MTTTTTKIRHSVLLERVIERIEAEPELWCQGKITRQVGSSGGPCRFTNCYRGFVFTELGVKLPPVEMGGADLKPTSFGLHYDDQLDVDALNAMVGEFDWQVEKALRKSGQHRSHPSSFSPVSLNDVDGQAPQKLAATLRLALPELRRRERVGGKNHLKAMVVPTDAIQELTKRSEALWVEWNARRPVMVGA
jgi:hypothetical protein